MSTNMFAKVPHSLFHEKGIRSATVAVYAALVSFCDKEGTAWPAVDTLAERAHVSDKVTRREVRLLESLGYLNVTPRRNPRSGGQTTNLYELRTPVRTAEAALVRETGGEIGQGGTGVSDRRGDGRNDPRSSTRGTKNHLNQSGAAEIVARVWSGVGSAQTAEAVAKVVNDALRNGNAPAAVEKALRAVAGAGQHVNSMTLTRALTGGATPLRGALLADQPRDWTQESEDW